jgi:molybdopterin synthase catalytic subunit
MIKVNVKLFGPLRDIVRRDVMELEVPDSSSGEQVFEEMVSVCPDLQKWKQSVRLAVNLEYTQLSHVIHAGDDVAFIPPVSGG